MSPMTLNYVTTPEKYNARTLRTCLPFVNHFTKLYKIRSSLIIVRSNSRYKSRNQIKSVLSELKIVSYNNYIATQKYIEETLYDSFKEIFITSNKGFLVNGINKDFLSPSLHKYIMDKTPEMLVYIRKLISLKINSSNKEDLFYQEVLHSLNEKFIYNLCLVTFLQVYTNQRTDNVKSYVFVPIIISLGKKIISFYINSMKDLYLKNEAIDHILFSEYRVI